MSRGYKSERHLALSQQWPSEPWPACSKCDGDGGNCACPQACMKPDRFDAEGRRELRWFVGGILCAVLALLGVLAWMSPLWSHT